MLINILNFSLILKIKIVSNKYWVYYITYFYRSSIIRSNARERIFSADDAQESPEENKRSNNVFSQWIDASSIKGFQLNKFWKWQESIKEDSETTMSHSKNK